MSHDDEVKKALAATNQRLLESYGKQDWAGCAACYSEDCQLYPPGAEAGVLKGKKGAEEVFSGTYKATGCTVFDLEAIDHVIGENTATQYGHYSLSDKSGKQVDKGTFVATYKQFGKEWLYIQDFFNSDLKEEDKSIDDEIRDANKEYEGYFKDNQLDTLVAESYTENCRLIPPGSPTIAGREGVKGFYASLKAGGSATIEIIQGPIIMVTDDAALMTDSGLKLFDASGKQTIDGICEVLFRKENGKWKMQYDIFNVK